MIWLQEDILVCLTDGAFVLYINGSFWMLFHPSLQQSSLSIIDTIFIMTSSQEISWSQLIAFLPSPSSLTLVWHSNTVIPQPINTPHTTHMTRSSVLLHSLPLYVRKELPNPVAMTWRPSPILSFIQHMGNYLGPAVTTPRQSLWRN